jgi:starvation-inducible DNA-binding protein
MNPNLGLTPEQQAGVLRLLNPFLADAMVLATRTRNYAWNVVGPQYHDLHQFFRLQLEEIDNLIEEIAQSIRALGGLTPGTLAEFLQLTRLTEQPGQQPGPREMVANLLADQECLVRQLREDMNQCFDQLQERGTAVFLSGLLGRHARMAGQLRAFLETPQG